MFHLTLVLHKDEHGCDQPHDHHLSKGQVILPKAIRDRLQWDAGTRLAVEHTADGVLLKLLATAFAQTRPEDVFGTLSYTGRPKLVEEMEAGIAVEAKRRHARGRY